MQKLIAKYGAAAHLAILAVAPLFLSLFFPETVTATVLLWLSLPAGVWIVLEPSLRNGESLRGARFRVVSEIATDPLFWASLALVAFAGVRALNWGIAMAYDAEAAKWYVTSARMPLFPGVVDAHGYLPFSALVAMTVLTQGCRHALGRSARVSFLLVASVLAGLAAMTAVGLVAAGHEGAVAAAQGVSRAYSYVGVAFGLHLLAGVVAVAAMFERKWNVLIPLAFPALGGTLAGAFAFAPALFGGVFAAFLLLLFVYALFSRSLEGAARFKFLVVSGVALALGGLFSVALLPEQLFQEKLSPFLTFTFFDDAFFRVRSVLSGIAFRSWTEHLWIGSGIASFPLDFRFAAEKADWELVKGGAMAVSNGWWLALAERGIVGLVALLTPFCFLVFTFFRKAAKGRGVPHLMCWLGPLSLLLLLSSGAVDCSFLRPDAMLAAGAFMAVSAKGFRGMKR